VNKNILVAFGGASPEHEVSVITAHQAIAALKNEDLYQVKPLYITKSGRWLTGDYLLELENFTDLKKAEANSNPCSFTQNEFGATVLSESRKSWFSGRNETVIDTVLVAFHGSKGENGSFQGICEMYNLPYTGSGVMGSSIGMDKVAAKSICRDHGIPVVDGVDFFESEWVEKKSIIIDKIEGLRYPAIIKPVHLGSSIGVQIVKNRESLISAVETAFKYDHHILVEKVVKPLMEINCSVLGSSHQNRASVCERPVGKEEILSFDDKYMSEQAAKGMASADRIIPANISESLSKDIQNSSQKIFSLLSCSGVARLDFLVDSDSLQFYFNEINTIPGSFSFYLWKESGLSFTDLLKEMIELAQSEYRNKGRQIQSYETNLLNKKAVMGIKGLKGTK
tara:strand:- start:27738 stop:28922 length:1185 start_codon:yes stop_codon:yes gene_type:complete